MQSKIESIAVKARESSRKLASASSERKDNALNEIAISLDKNKSAILKANKLDIIQAEKSRLSQSLLARLKLSDEKISEIISSVHGVIFQDEPVGKTLSAVEMDNGLELFQVTCPIGVIGVIFESRPDAAVQISSLCIKSGNAVIMKGGSEAVNSNRILVGIIRESLKKSGLPPDSVQLIETREDVKQMLSMDKYIDLIVPRGSNSFVKFIKENTKIPVVGHDEGICHLYIDKKAGMKKALDISFDAKCQYPAVCNAMETLLVHKDIADKFLPKIAERYKDAKVEIRGDDAVIKILKGQKGFSVKKAVEKDWATEYNDMIISIKVVNSVEEAISHINKFGSRHTEAIITKDDKSAFKFLNDVDASSVMRNCSTRFADGFRYGKGAELGISTAKLHPRGPVGLEGLVTYKYILVGNGHVVASYSGKKPRMFTHKKIDKLWHKSFSEGNEDIVKHTNI